MDERRKASRLDRTLEAIWIRPDELSRLLTTDVSASGFQVITRQEMSVGDELSLSFNLGDFEPDELGRLVMAGEQRAIKLNARVVWVREMGESGSRRVGCEFEGLTSEEQRELESFVEARLSGEDQSP